MHRPADEVGLDTMLLEEIKTSVGLRIRKLREERGLSQRAASRDAGMHQTDWSRIERGMVDPRLSTLIRIQYALNLDVFEALFGQLPSRSLLEREGRSG